MAKIRDLGINFIPGAGRNDIELTPVVMAVAADGDRDECDAGGDNCSATLDECDGPENNCSATLDECDGPGNNCSATLDECDEEANNCSATLDECDEEANNCSATLDDEEEDDDKDDPGHPKKSTKGLSGNDVALLTQQLEHHLANELVN